MHTFLCAFPLNTVSNLRMSVESRLCKEIIKEEFGIYASVCHLLAVHMRF